MRIRHVPAVVLMMALAAFVPAVGLAQQTPPPAQEKPAEPKAAATIAGKWDLSAETPQGVTAATLVIKLDGKKVTGTMTGPQGELPHEGEYVDGKLTTAITIQGNGGTMNITFTGGLKEDGTMAGTFDFGQGAMNWKATRAKN
jgi:hypothetical protein